MLIMSEFSGNDSVFTTKQMAERKDLIRQYYISVSYPGSGLGNWILMT